MKNVRSVNVLKSLVLTAALTGLLVTPAVAIVTHNGPGFSLTASETIAEAQSILRMDGYLAAGAYREGELDDATRSALKAFQRRHGLPATGYLDWETMSQMPSHEQAMLDSDGDGVADQDDRCPDTPRGASVDANGCPGDADGDGVYDGLDRCPNTPKGATVDANGCPKDSDGDGVYDGLDRCPNTPKGATVDANGCPKDSDGDGVYDGLDRCPDTPKGDKVDSKGCSIPIPPPLAVKESLVLEGVNFETNSATLTGGSSARLDRVANSLAKWPEVRIELGGHTDSTGDDAYNLDLSTRRAAAVRDYLVKKGTDASRIAVKGYGESVPIADNATKEGRAENRRVELKRLK